MSKTASSACHFCKKRKRKCNGELPCSTCLRFNNSHNCVYQQDQDRRKWKFDSSYVDYLEIKSDILENFKNHLTSIDPSKAELISASIKEENPTLPRSLPKLDEALVKNTNPKALDEMTNTTWRVRESNGLTEFYGPLSGRQQVIESDDIPAEYNIDDNSGFFCGENPLRERIFSSFETFFADYFFISKLKLSSLRRCNFLKLSLSEKLLLYSILAYGAVFSGHKDLYCLFEHEAESILVEVCKKHLDENVIQALLISSCLSLGMGYDSKSWLLNAMCCSQAQFLRMHLNESPQGTEGSLVSDNRHTSALFWSVIIQDRFITSVLGRGCRIQYFRILRPFYANTGDVGESVFSYHSRLWYIHDRSMSQIYSFKARHLHESHRRILLTQGLTSLQELHNSLPPSLKLTPQTQDPRVLLFHLSYSVVAVLLHKAYIAQNPSKIIQICLEHSSLACKIVRRYDTLHGFHNSPYFSEYLIFQMSMFDLFLLACKNEAYQQEATMRLYVYLDALASFGSTWRRGIKDIRALISLANSWNVSHEKLEALAPVYGPVTPSQDSVLDELDEVRQQYENVFAQPDGLEYASTDSFFEQLPSFDFGLDEFAFSL